MRLRQSQPSKVSLRHKLFESAWANGRITLFDPPEAEDAIPELVAFWLFLQRQYNLRSAAAIVKYLESLAPKFPATVSDPKRGGIAKRRKHRGLSLFLHLLLRLFLRRGII